MLVTYKKLIRITTVCAIFVTPTSALRTTTDKLPHKPKRSLNNYVASSVPYIVEHAAGGDFHYSQPSSSSVTENIDTALLAQDGTSNSHSQDILDCVSGDDNHCASNMGLDDHSLVEGTFRPYSQDELNKILQKYENKKDHFEAQETSNKDTNYYGIPNSNNIESSSPPLNDKSKTWNAVNQTHSHNKNSSEDRMGWVTLEPVPWSSSNVQKWEPNMRPPNRPAGPSQSNIGQWSSNAAHQQHLSSYTTFSDQPVKKPSYQYQSKPWNANQHFSKPHYSNQQPNQEIITDGQPGYFPPEKPSAQTSHRPWLEHSQSISYADSGDRPSTHVIYQGISSSNSGGGGYLHHQPHSPDHREPPQAATSSAEATPVDGHWVLLSSTKGYSLPHHQPGRQSARSRRLPQAPDTEEYKARRAESSATTKDENRGRPLSARRSIRLTVLPPLPGAGNIKTSHNGLIEVEASDQTVEEAHRQHFARMMRLGNSTNNQVRQRSSSLRGFPARIEKVSKPAERRNTILSAVSAGMIPATMAAILPMLLGRRRRRSVPEAENLAMSSNSGYTEIHVKFPKKWRMQVPKKNITF